MRVRVLRNRRDAEAAFAESEQRHEAKVTRRIVEAMVEERAARDLIGSSGHYIQKVGDKYGVFSPDGVLLIIKREKSEAERCASEHATTGRITAV